MAVAADVPRALTLFLQVKYLVSTVCSNLKGSATVLADVPTFP